MKCSITNQHPDKCVLSGFALRGHRLITHCSYCHTLGGVTGTLQQYTISTTLAMQQVKGCTICEVPARYHCSRCQTVSYCGSGHQRLDWAQHKKTCRATADITTARMTAGSSDSVRGCLGGMPSKKKQKNNDDGELHCSHCLKFLAARTYRVRFRAFDCTQPFVLRIISPLLGIMRHNNGSLP